MADFCRPVAVLRTSDFWWGFAVGVIGTLIVARVLGRLVF
jgi:hypothetical protein